MAIKMEFFISKLSFRENVSLIKDVYCYEYDGKYISEGTTRQRSWMVSRTDEGHYFSSLSRNIKGGWIRENQFTYNLGLYNWGIILPENIPMRKTFISFYHKEDGVYRKIFDNLFGDLIISKSVKMGDIDSDNSDEYIKQLIQKDYLSDVTLLIVLIGPNTKLRKHVDWEISGALDYKIGDNYSGLLGILLPTHPDFGKTNYYPMNVPDRFAHNAKSGYAVLSDWTDNRCKMQSLIESAYKNRSNSDKIVNREIPQMQKDRIQ